MFSCQFTQYINICRVITRPSNEYNLELALRLRVRVRLRLMLRVRVKVSMRVSVRLGAAPTTQGKGVG